jgi:hypothetical protein
MSLTARSRILLGMLVNNKDLKVFLIHVLIGALLQILARRCLKYMEDHPELFEKTNTNRKKAKPRNKNKKPLVVPRGGAFVVPPQVFEFINYLNETGILKFIANSGVISTAATGAAGYLIKQIPLKAVSTYVRNSARGALPATHGYIDKSVTTLDDVGKLTLYQCEGINELGYLFYVLKDSAIPFEEKERITILILTKFLNLSTEEGRRNSLLCLLAILCALAIYSPSSYHLLLKILLQAIREGKISKKLIRWIIRRLKRNGLLLNPELLDIAYSSNLVELP